MLPVTACFKKTKKMEEGLLTIEDLENMDDALVESDDVESMQDDGIDINDLEDLDEAWITHTKSKNEYCKIKGSYTYDAATRKYTLTPGTKKSYYKIRLTRGKVTIVSKRQFKRIRKHRWWTQQIKKKEGELWYAVGYVKGRTVMMHQFLTDYRYEQVDHINGDGLMNIEENLRDGGGGINSRNRKDAKGVYYQEYFKCYHAHYYEWDGKQIVKRFYVRDYASKEDTRLEAELWYQTNAGRIRQQIIRDGECPEEDKHKPTPKSSNSGERNIVDHPDQNGFQVQVWRDGKKHTKWCSYSTRDKEEVLQEAIVWRDEFIAANPLKPRGGSKKQKTE
jgi:hypothetical protein